MAENESLITDEMRGLVGEESEPVTYDIEAGLIRQFAQAIGDDNPLWQDESEARDARWAGITAPPTFLRTCEPNPNRDVSIPVSRGLDAGSEWEYFLPVRPGDRITVTRRVTDFTQKEGRLGQMLLSTAEVRYVNQFGKLVATQTERGISY
jgi:acyl dehydratase